MGYRRLRRAARADFKRFRHPTLFRIEASREDAAHTRRAIQWGSGVGKPAPLVVPQGTREWEKTSCLVQGSERFAATDLDRRVFFGDGMDGTAEFSGSYQRGYSAWSGNPYSSGPGKNWQAREAGSSEGGNTEEGRSTPLRLILHKEMKRHFLL